VLRYLKVGGSGLAAAPGLTLGRFPRGVECFWRPHAERLIGGLFVAWLYWYAIVLYADDERAWLLARKKKAVKR
jgi:hypothetical protein